MSTVAGNYGQAGRFELFLINLKLCTGTREEEVRNENVQTAEKEASFHFSRQGHAFNFYYLFRISTFL